MHPLNEDRESEGLCTYLPASKAAFMTRERMSTTSLTYAFASFKRSHSGVLDVGHAAQGVFAALLAQIVICTTPTRGAND